MDLSHLPHAPGVYLMRDNQARIIYIGKAKDLKKRVSSYFQKKGVHPKLVSLLSFVQQIDYISTSSERASLILEQKLIHRFQPLYNTMWRDDKSYPYVKLTLNEDYPRLILTRQKVQDGARYFGPYPDVKVIKSLLRTLWRKKLFPLRPCNFPFLEKDITSTGGLHSNQPALYKKVKSCIYLHTGECPAPCVGRILKQDYDKIVHAALLFFQGKQGHLRLKLGKEMKIASDNLDFERAAQLRDQLFALSHISERVIVKEVDENTVVGQMQISRALTEIQGKLNLPRPPIRIEAFDISNIQGTEPVGSLAVFENGKPLKSAYRKFKIKTVKGQDDFAMMEEIVMRRYRRILQEDRKLPDLIVIDGGKGQLNAALNAFQSLEKSGMNLSHSILSVCALAKQNEEIFIPNQDEPIRLPKDSPALHILQSIRDEAHRFAVTFHRQKRRKSFLKVRGF